MMAKTKAQLQVALQTARSDLLDMKHDLRQAKQQNRNFQREMKSLNSAKSTDIQRFLDAARDLTNRLACPTEPELYLENRLAEIRETLRPLIRIEIAQTNIADEQKKIRKLITPPKTPPSLARLWWSYLTGK